MRETYLLTLSGKEQRALVEMLNSELRRRARPARATEQQQHDAVLFGVLRKLTLADDAQTTVVR